MDLKNRSITKIPKKQIAWWEDYEESMTITEKVWTVFQEIPKRKTVVCHTNNTAGQQG